LNNAPEAGKHHGKIQGICGNIDFSEVPPIDVPLVVTSVYPSTKFSRYGNDFVTIKGSGFSTHHKPIVAFKNGPALKVRSFSSTEITCITERFD
jgi:hypothetical protein